MNKIYEFLKLADALDEQGKYVESDSVMLQMIRYSQTADQAYNSFNLLNNNTTQSAEKVLSKPGVRSAIQRILQKFIPKLTELAARKGIQAAAQDVVAEAGPEIVAAVPEAAEVVAAGAAGVTIGALIVPVLIGLAISAGIYGAVAWYESYHNYGLQKVSESEQKTFGQASSSQLANHYLSQLSNELRSGKDFDFASKVIRGQMVDAGATKQDLDFYDAEAQRYNDPNYFKNHPSASAPTSTSDITPASTNAYPSNLSGGLISNNQPYQSSGQWVSKNGIMSYEPGVIPNPSVDVDTSTPQPQTSSKSGYDENGAWRYPS